MGKKGNLSKIIRAPNGKKKKKKRKRNVLQLGPSTKKGTEEKRGKADSYAVVEKRRTRVGKKKGRPGKLSPPSDGKEKKEEHPYSASSPGGRIRPEREGKPAARS